jgi:hypothetical protein
MTTLMQELRTGAGIGVKWCRGRESNPYGPFGPEGF